MAEGAKLHSLYCLLAIPTLATTVEQVVILVASSASTAVRGVMQCVHSLHSDYNLDIPSSNCLLLPFAETSLQLL